MGTRMHARHQEHVFPLCCQRRDRFIFRCLAVNTVARAMASSTSAGGRSKRRSERERILFFHASTTLAPSAATVSTGYWPVAVSADSITASVPSSTAFARRTPPQGRDGVS